MRWSGRFGTLADFIKTETTRTLESYRSQPNLIAEHANAESAIAHGGYADRQVIELIQNASDSLLEAANNSGRIEIRLTENCLYCADDGRPIDEDGIRALMFARLSPKRGTTAIGRFGLGFKSVLRVTDAPEFHSRSVSFKFDAEAAKAQIREATKETDGPYPVLRLPEPIVPGVSGGDESFEEFKGWATNIVRLPLRADRGARLERQIRDFPPEFLLFVDHVQELRLDDGQTSRCTVLSSHGNERLLTVADAGNRESRTSRWLVFRTIHTLSLEARDDPRTPDAPKGAALSWAAPLDRRTEFRHFWASFPTQTPSLLAGILNAPWKTNEDRQNLLPGSYNDELVRAAARLVADHLRELSAKDDPSAHLDALPRRPEAGDSEHAALLRREVFQLLSERPVVPDQNGDLRRIRDLRYPPKELTSGNSVDQAPFKQWASCPTRPEGWLHHSALNRVRLATIDRLFPSNYWPASAPRASLKEWLEVLVKGSSAEQAVTASMAAVSTAEAIPEAIRQGKDLGNIVLTEDNEWKPVDPDSVFLPTETNAVDGEEASTVHRRLSEDPATKKVLQVLGLRTPSPEATFRQAAGRALPGSSQAEPAEAVWPAFWAAARSLSPDKVLDVAAKIARRPGALPYRVRARTLAGTWQPLASVLLPGSIVPRDGSRDIEATIDETFHHRDLNLLKRLGATDRPEPGWDLSFGVDFEAFLRECDSEYRRRPDLPANPHSGYLSFGYWPADGDFVRSTKEAGPLDVLARLSDDGRLAYTDELLKREETFTCWPMGHHGTNGRTYPSASFRSLAVRVLMKHGRIRTLTGIVPFGEVLDEPPKNVEALDVLYRRENWEAIRDAFDLTDPTPRFGGEAEPVPLTDVWSGLTQHLMWPECQLIRCKRILVAGRDVDCRASHSNVYLADSVADEEKQLRLVSRELELNLTEDMFQADPRPEDTQGSPGPPRRDPPKVVRRRSVACRRRRAGSSQPTTPNAARHA